jgi:hypothetical protein
MRHESGKGMMNVPGKHPRKGIGGFKLLNLTIFFKDVFGGF